VISTVGILSHGIAAVAFGALSLILFARLEGTHASRWLIAASAATAVWATLVALFGGTVGPSAAETVRSGAWLAFVASLVTSNWQGEAAGRSRQVLGAVSLLIGLQLVADIWALARGGLPPGAAYVYTLTRLAASIGALVLTHNVYVNSAPSNRWSIRLLCIALAGVFGYDLNLYTLQLLGGTLNTDLWEVRGIANALVVPLIYMSAARNRELRLQVSRQAAFHTLSLGAIGAYLVLMSLAGYGLRLVGGDWGRFLQISFIFATIIFAATVLLSGRARAWLRVQINKHLFAYKYDYRQEWMRFVSTVSSSGPGMGELQERVVQAVCEPVDSPGGALFLENEDGSFDQVARWNYRTIRQRHLGTGSNLAGHFSRTTRVVNLDEYRSGDSAYRELRLPEWLTADDQAWLIIPLLHIDTPIGFILVERPLARRELDWEDFDILRTVGRQAASYVAEAAALAKIAESRKFDEFNRRFAFIMHDLKNLVSQLSLVSRNAERHADNPEFRADMAATLKSSVAKMNDLLARLSQQQAQTSDVGEIVDIARIAREVAHSKRQIWPNLVMNGDGGSAPVRGSEGKIEQVLTHLVQNAIDASDTGDEIVVSMAKEPGEVRIDIRDHGRGMSAEFIRSELFEPFKSTKKDGFGIGAYEAREMTRELGGRLAVVSEPGAGTCFSIHLPLAPGDNGKEA
jgi:putative PEP-CTERM system histidine kinase